MIRKRGRLHKACLIYIRSERERVEEGERYGVLMASCVLTGTYMDKEKKKNIENIRITTNVGRDVDGHEPSGT